MIIGYAVEGSTDRAFLKGLRQRWCPQAEIVEGAFRGSTGLSLRREVPKICFELDYKGAGVMIFLTDANEQEWRRVQMAERKHVPQKYEHRVIYGVADRNIECWLAADREYLARKLGCNPAELKVDDPKGVFESYLGIAPADRKELEIAAIVKEAPLRNWIDRSLSFEAFWEDCWNMSKRQGCDIPNEREKN
jgi:hypothetical protein